MDSDWAHLPEHLLDSILEGIQSSIDYLQFSVVCDSWHSVAKDNQCRPIKRLSHHHAPMLLFPPKRRKSGTWSLYSISNNKFLEKKLLLPRYGRSVFGGSSEGWLATMNEKLAVSLYKPFVVNEVINLPPLLLPTDNVVEETNHEYLERYLVKVLTVTPDPIENSSDLICVAIFGEFWDLAYIRPAKDTTWTHVTGMERVLFEDVVYYNNQFYAISYRGKLGCFDITNSNLRLLINEVPKDDKRQHLCYKKYLVEYGGELLLIQRYVLGTGLQDFDPVTIKFKVFKLSFDGPKWIEKKSLGDAALFLGVNSSISVLASNFAGCRRNCIYFTHDKNSVTIGGKGPSDLGVYDLESGSLTPYFTIDPTIFPKLRKRAIWIVPPLNMY